MIKEDIFPHRKFCKLYLEGMFFHTLDYSAELILLEKDVREGYVLYKICCKTAIYTCFNRSYYLNRNSSLISTYFGIIFISPSHAVDVQQVTQLVF